MTWPKIVEAKYSRCGVIYGYITIIALRERVRYNKMYEGLINRIDRIWYVGPVYAREIKIAY